MTGFFCVSGYTCFQTYKNKDLTKLKNIRSYIINRLIGILPLYYVVSIVYVCVLGTENLLENFLLFPIEFLGIQSTFTSLFDRTHNGGT